MSSQVSENGGGSSSNSSAEGKVIVETAIDKVPADIQTITDDSADTQSVSSAPQVETPAVLPATSAPGVSMTTAATAPANINNSDGYGLDGLDDIIGPGQNSSIAERSPGGRYVRFMEKLGSGASKDVYRAYDTQEGIEVAWNVVNLAGVPKSERNRIVNEVRLLERLHHQNIISFHGSWVNRERQEVNFVTEILSSGTLKSFINKVQVIRWKIAKRWAVQILKGLEYLHSQDPPVIHRDLKCDNIFINGTSGDLRIGDLGLSTVHRNGKVLSVLGTPEFMAPDMYEENSYDEKVDIYAFGMCLLEIFTKEIPYSECSNPAQIYNRVIREQPPEVLKRLKSRHAREFINYCLGYRDENGKYIRPTCTELLAHEFLLKRSNDDDEVEVEPSLMHHTIGETTTESMSQQKAASRRSQENSSRDVSQPESKKVPEKANPSEQGSSPPKPAEPSSNSVEEDESDRFDEMPDSEINIVKRVKVMMGRDQELEEDDDEKNSPEPVAVNVPPTDCQTQSTAKTETPTILDSEQINQNTAAATANVDSDEGGSLVQIEPATTQSSAQGQQQSSNLQYLVAAAVIDNEQPNAIPYDDDILKLVVTLPVDGQTQNVQFDFHLVNDDPVKVAREMVTELGIPQGAGLEISETISALASSARMRQEHYWSMQYAQNNLMQQPSSQSMMGQQQQQQQQPQHQQTQHQPSQHQPSQHQPPQQQQSQQGVGMQPGMNQANEYHSQSLMSDYMNGQQMVQPQQNQPQMQSQHHRSQQQQNIPQQTHVQHHGGQHMAQPINQHNAQHQQMQNMQQQSRAPPHEQLSAQNQQMGQHNMHQIQQPTLQQQQPQPLHQPHLMNTNSQHQPPAPNQQTRMQPQLVPQQAHPGGNEYRPHSGQESQSQATYETNASTLDHHSVQQNLQYQQHMNPVQHHQSVGKHMGGEFASSVQGQNQTLPQHLAQAQPQQQQGQVQPGSSSIQKSNQAGHQVPHQQAQQVVTNQSVQQVAPSTDNSPTQSQQYTKGTSASMNNISQAEQLNSTTAVPQLPSPHIPGRSDSAGVSNGLQVNATEPSLPSIVKPEVALTTRQRSGSSGSDGQPTQQQDISTAINGIGRTLSETVPNYDDLDEDEKAELRRLDEEMKKTMLRAKKVFVNRMDNLHRTLSEREAQHKKTLQKHQKERAEFEKRMQQEEIEQNRRLEQLQREWELKREAVGHKQNGGSEEDVGVEQQQQQQQHPQQQQQQQQQMRPNTTSETTGGNEPLDT